jgi:hypothetical protein
MKSYSELKKLNTFEERFEYLKLDGKVGVDTFGYDRYLNQHVYKSNRWKSARAKVIIRDDGCDLGIQDYPIHGRLLVHHMNPITIEDIENDNPDIYNPEYLISTSNRTHQAIHYSDNSLISKPPVERKPNDTTPWRK